MPRGLKRLRKLLFFSGGEKLLSQLLEPLVRYLETLLRVSQMLSHQVEILAEPAEVAFEATQILPDLFRARLDLQALESQNDRLEIGVEAVRRNRNHALRHRVGAERLVVRDAVFL